MMMGDDPSFRDDIFWKFQIRRSHQPQSNYPFEWNNAIYIVTQYMRASNIRLV